MDQTTPDSPLPVPIDHPGSEGTPGTSRRHVLGLAVVAGASLPVLVACGGGSDTTTTSSGDATPSDAASSSAAAGPLVATADVPVNGGVVLDEQKIVVTQPTKGTFKAFTAVCTHQACTVGSVKDGVISCPCHGSAYSAADGSVKNGPATRPLKEIAITVEGDEIVEA